MEQYSMINVNYENGVAYIGMNRQEARNALNYQLLDEIMHACIDADNCEEIGVVVLYSQVPSVFCAGADIKERRSMTDEEVVKRRQFARDVYSTLENLEKPLIVAVDGKCIGGGCEIIGSADLIFSSDISTFRYVEVAVGSVGATQRVTRLVGRQHANDLLFSSRTIDAEEAWHMGLVARMFKQEEFMANVTETAEKIASYPRVTLLATKKAIKMAAYTSPEQGVMFEQMAIGYNLAKNDWRGSLDNFKQTTKKENGK